MYMYTELVWKDQHIFNECFSQTKLTAHSVRHLLKTEHELDTESLLGYTCTVQSLPVKVRNLATLL